MQAMAILCPCGAVVSAVGDDEWGCPDAWERLNEHQAACGLNGFVAYETVRTLDGSPDGAEETARRRIEHRRTRWREEETP